MSCAPSDDESIDMECDEQVPLTFLSDDEEDEVHLQADDEDDECLMWIYDPVFQDWYQAPAYADVAKDPSTDPFINV